MKKQTHSQHLMELRILDQQIKEIQEQLQALESQSAELLQIEMAIDELAGIAKGAEMLVPVAGGIFIRTELKDASTFLLNVGAGMTVEKSQDETKILLERQRDDLLSLQTDLAQRLEVLIDTAVELQQLLQKG